VEVTTQRKTFEVAPMIIYNFEEKMYEKIFVLAEMRELTENA
jgi:hypothetical protein